MPENGEITTLSKRHKRILSFARRELNNRKAVISDQFKKSLLVASNALQSIRMIENLDLVVERKKKEGNDYHDLEMELQNARERFIQAVRDYDESAIFDIEGLVEQMTLSHDPIYLEGDEIRKREYFERRRKQGIARPTWASNPSSRFVSLMRGDLQGVEEVTEAEQRSCISTCAWSFAIIGLIVAISFLIADFWSAQINPALSTNLFVNDKLELPVVYGCLTIPLIPTFENIREEGYAGFPLWGLRSYSNLETGESILYPKTKELITQTSFLGRDEYCKKALSYLSKEAISSSMNADFNPAEKCFTCLRIGMRKEISLNRSLAADRPTGAITLEFAASRDLDYCFNPYYGTVTFLKDGIQKMLKENGEELVKKGIVTLLNGSDIDFAIDYGFDDFRKAFPKDNVRKNIAQASVFCNLYFFSGYFFPVKPGTEVRYSFDMNGGIESWKPLGDPVNFLEVHPSFSLFNMVQTNRTHFLNQIQSPIQTSKLSEDMTIHIYAKNRNSGASQPAFKDFVSALRQNQRDVILFKKSTDSGISRYSSAVQLGSKKLFRTEGRFRRFNISFDYSTFETEVITRRPTTSVSEFLTDVFEYIGLFTGVCAYSVLVSPARMYLKLAKTNRKS